MTRRDYIESIVPQPFRILGKRLKPLSVGHLILLEYIESPFISGSPVSTGDLVNAIFICSRSFEETMEAWQDKGTSHKITEWGKRVGPFDLEEKCKLFQEYVGYYHRWPESDSKHEGNGKLGSPEYAVILDVLQSDLNYSESDAINMPYNKAAWKCSAHLERLGIIEIEPEDSNTEAELLEARKFADEQHNRLVELYVKR